MTEIFSPAGPRRMTKAEQANLQRLGKLNKDGAIAAQKERTKQALAEFEMRLAAQFTYDQRETWAYLMASAKRHVDEMDRRRAEVPWLFIRQQTGSGVLVCCTIPTSGRPLSENDEAEIKSARERLARLHESGDLPAGVAWFWPQSDRQPEPISPEPGWLQAQTTRHRVFQVRMR